MLLENQYAHVSGEGRLSALSPAGISASSHVVERQTSRPDGKGRNKIEHAAREVHKLTWKHRHELFPHGVPVNLVDLLDPAIAARVTGYTYEQVAGFGKSTRSIGSEVAGELDRQAKRIRVSAQFPLHIQRFTAAHELGHACLHQDVRMHRDRPLDAPRRASGTRDKHEWEADKFAVFFLMPEKLVRQRFQELFQCTIFAFDDDTIFALNQVDSPDLYRRGKETIRLRSRTLASTTIYNGRHFDCLADQFRVSVETMAIRLEELDMIEA